MKNKSKDGHRPLGCTSRIRRAGGPGKVWTAPNGQAVCLPLIVDHVNIDPQSGVCVWRIEARVDLVLGKPELVEVRLKGDPCLDSVHLQRFFRWATPIEVVRVTVPALLEEGVDPFRHEYAIDGYPDAANINRKNSNKLSDEFLREVARQYIEVGHGYAHSIAAQRGVSRRTVVSWVEKARKRGILGPTTAGRRNRRILSEKPPENTD